MQRSIAKNLAPLATSALASRYLTRRSPRPSGAGGGLPPPRGNTAACPAISTAPRVENFFVFIDFCLICNIDMRNCLGDSVLLKPFQTGEGFLLRFRCVHFIEEKSHALEFLCGKGLQLHNSSGITRMQTRIAWFRVRMLHLPANPEASSCEKSTQHDICDAQVKGRMQSSSPSARLKCKRTGKVQRRKENLGRFQESCLIPCNKGRGKP